jgi:hypothetical protein
LDKDAAELGANNRARRTGLETAGVFTMLANIGGKNPGHLVAGVAANPGRGWFFDKLDVTPRGSSDRSSVVVRIAAPFKAILADLIPFLAGHLAGFAANTQCRVG